jgi:LytS/YehU family sensor histidine kinase
VLKVVYFMDFILAIAIHLGYISSYFFNQWKLSLQKTERLEKEKTQVQFDNLKNQLNPHFLFNSLTLLDGLIHEDPALASQFLQHMSKVYRYILQNKEKELVTVSTENNFIENYISLMETRFGAALSIERKFSPAALEKKVVPVTLQILIENAIKHNIATQAQPLKIEIMNDEKFLWVRNNLQLKPQVEHSNRQGLDNLKALYHYLSPLAVDVQRNETHFCVKVPLLAE